MKILVFVSGILYGTVLFLSGCEEGRTKNVANRPPRVPPPSEAFAGKYLEKHDWCRSFTASYRNLPCNDLVVKYQFKKTAYGKFSVEPRFKENFLICAAYQVPALAFKISIENFMVSFIGNDRVIVEFADQRLDFEADVSFQESTIEMGATSSPRHWIFYICE